MSTAQPLDAGLIKLGLGGLGPTADGASIVYLHCNIDNLSLTNLNALAEYGNLQHVSACSNLLEDATCLSPLKSLRSLRVSRNRIRDAEKALPDVFALQLLDLSHNSISVMPSCLPKHRYLRILKLDNNQVEVISGLEGLASLVELSLNDNLLQSVSGLEGTSLRRLFVAGNEISDVSGVDAVSGTLVQFVASSNVITSLKHIDRLEKLVELDLAGNRIGNTTELQRLKKLSHLRVLLADDNPMFVHTPPCNDGCGNDDASDIVCEDNDSSYDRPPTPECPVNPLGSAVPADPSTLNNDLLLRYTTLFAVPQLTSLNGCDVTRHEKVKALNILGNADIESRAKNEMQFLNTAITQVGGS